MIPTLIINLLPSVDFTLNSNFLDSGGQLLNCVGYVMPIVGLMPIFVSSASLEMFRISWALLIRVKGFIPTMGG
jgi:hypothetical protein